MLAKWLDWRDSSGKMDHGKVVPDLTLAVLLGLQVFATIISGRLPDFVWGVIDLSAAFGGSSWRAFLRNKTATTQALLTTSVQTTVKADVGQVIHDLMPARGTIEPDGGDYLMAIPQAAVLIAKKWEGCSLSVYKDLAGNPTVGYGHKLGLDELQNRAVLVPQTCPIIDPQAEAILAQDMEIADRAIGAYVHVTLTPTQRAALISFIFNIGAEAFKNSTLLHLLNAGHYGLVPAQMKRWVYSGGKKYAGLEARRVEEANLFMGVTPEK